MGGYCETLLQLTMQHADARSERQNGSLRGLQVQGLQLIHSKYSTVLSGPGNRCQLRSRLNFSRASLYLWLTATGAQFCSNWTLMVDLSAVQRTYYEKEFQLSRLSGLDSYISKINNKILLKSMFSISMTIRCRCFITIFFDSMSITLFQKPNFQFD